MSNIIEIFPIVGATGPTGPQGPVGPAAIAGKTPNTFVESENAYGTTSATFVDIPGLSASISLDSSVEVLGLCSAQIQTLTGTTASTIGLCLNFDGVDHMEHKRYLSGQNDIGLGMVMHSSAILDSGTHTVKVRLRRVDGLATPGFANGTLFLQAQQGAVGPTGPSGSQGPTGPTGPQGPVFSGDLSGSALFNYYNTSSLNTLVGSGSQNYFTVNVTNTNPMLGDSTLFMFNSRTYAHLKNQRTVCGIYDSCAQVLLTGSNCQIISEQFEDRIPTGSNIIINSLTSSGGTLKFYAESNTTTASLSTFCWWDKGMVLV